MVNTVNYEHTPGPWARHHVLRPYQVYNTGYEQLICNVINRDDPFSTHSDTEAIANAQLIAAAPEMLDALLECRAKLEQAMAAGFLPPGITETVIRAELVIEKATTA